MKYSFESQIYIDVLTCSVVAEIENYIQETAWIPSNIVTESIEIS